MNQLTYSRCSVFVYGADMTDHAFPDTIPAVFWFTEEEILTSARPVIVEDNLAPSCGAINGFLLGALMWAGIALIWRFLC